MDKTNNKQSSSVATDPVSNHETSPQADDHSGAPRPTVSPIMASYHWRRLGQPAPIGDIKPRRPLMITDI